MADIVAKHGMAPVFSDALVDRFRRAQHAQNAGLGSCDIAAFAKILRAPARG